MSESADLPSDSTPAPAHDDLISLIAARRERDELALELCKTATLIELTGVALAQFRRYTAYIGDLDHIHARLDPVEAANISACVQALADRVQEIKQQRLLRRPVPEPVYQLIEILVQINSSVTEIVELHSGSISSQPKDNQEREDWLVNNIREALAAGSAQAADAQQLWNSKRDLFYC